MGHPAKEGLRLIKSFLIIFSVFFPRVGHPAKEGLRLSTALAGDLVLLAPEWVIQQKRD